MVPRSSPSRLVFNIVWLIINIVWLCLRLAKVELIALQHRIPGRRLRATAARAARFVFEPLLEADVMEDMAAFKLGAEDSNFFEADGAHDCII